MAQNDWIGLLYGFVVPELCVLRESILSVGFFSLQNPFSRRHLSGERFHFYSSLVSVCLAKQIKYFYNI